MSSRVDKLFPTIVLMAAARERRKPVQMLSIGTSLAILSEGYPLSYNFSNWNRGM
jgi:hypothetical protein